MRRDLPGILQVALDRGYIKADAADRIAGEARTTHRPADLLLVERGVLSARRLERLQVHVRYRTLRKVDKAYAKVAARTIDEKQVRAALDIQRDRFEKKRECHRLGAILVKQGRLTMEQDRMIRARVARVSATHASGSDNQSAAELLEESNASQPKAPAAVAARAPQGGGHRDSAADTESACVQRARERVTSQPPPAPRAPSKSTRKHAVAKTSKRTPSRTGQLRLGA